MNWRGFGRKGPWRADMPGVYEENHDLYENKLGDCSVSATLSAKCQVSEV
jgi:hypothetical protein